MGEIKLQRVMFPHLRPLTKTRTTVFVSFFYICMRILSICYIFVEFSLFHVLRSVPKNYFKQSSLNTLKLKKVTDKMNDVSVSLFK